MRGAAVHDDGIDRSRGATRLAQRAGGQQQAVAEAALAVDDRDLDVARQRVVLQAVVAHQHVASRAAEQRLGGGDAVGARPHGIRAASDEDTGDEESDAAAR